MCWREWMLPPFLHKNASVCSAKLHHKYICKCATVPSTRRHSLSFFDNPLHSHFEEMYIFGQSWRWIVLHFLHHHHHFSHSSLKPSSVGRHSHLVTYSPIFFRVNIQFYELFSNLEIRFTWCHHALCLIICITNATIFLHELVTYLQVWNVPWV